MAERVIWFQVLEVKDVVRSQELGKAKGRSVLAVYSIPASAKPSIMKLELVAELRLNVRSRVNGREVAGPGGSKTARSLEGDEVS